MNDSESLERYAVRQGEPSFTDLVKRNIDLVYSAALRQVGGDAHRAQDVAQSVFIDLARKIGSGGGPALLTGWLYTSTRFAAAKLIRTEQRRQAREQEATTMNELLREDAPEPSWDEIRPVLDEAMHELSEADRNAVLLRYFEGRQLAEVGTKLGLGEDAARKRVGRALEKLREVLARRGVTSSTAALAAVFASQAVTAAPAGLAVSIAGAAVASSAAGAGTTLTFLKIMTMTKAQMAVVGAVLVAGVATPLVLQHGEQLKLERANAALRAENQQLVAQVAPLADENQRLSGLLAQAGASRSAPTGEPSTELLRLRGEVGRLRADALELARSTGAGSTANDSEIEAMAQALAGRATQLKQRLEQMPEKKIPELQLLSQKDWLNAVSDVKPLETDEDYRQAMCTLRSTAKGRFGAAMQQALKQYAEANGGLLPTDLSQLQPWLGSTLDASMLQRYRLAQTGKLSDVTRDQELIAEIASPVDDEFDTHFTFRVNGTTSKTVNKTTDALEAAAVAYASANGGLLPREAGQIAPFLQRPLDNGVVQKYLNKVPAHITTLEQYQASRK
jgi:RNA polymerase sigma factor (sigma-70 family)